MHKARGRALLLAFSSWMAFSAIYLDHHWVIDAIIGAAYALATAGIVQWGARFARRKYAPENASALPPRADGEGTLASPSAEEARPQWLG
jgi:membrane-associated phospholipid phosphatase